jgi:hypothetical protein
MSLALHVNRMHKQVFELNKAKLDEEVKKKDGRKTQLLAARRLQNSTR